MKNGVMSKPDAAGPSEDWNALMQSAWRLAMQHGPIERAQVICDVIERMLATDVGGDELNGLSGLLRRARAHRAAMERGSDGAADARSEVSTSIHVDRNRRRDAAQRASSLDALELARRDPAEWFQRTAAEPLPWDDEPCGLTRAQVRKCGAVLRAWALNEKPLWADTGQDVITLLEVSAAPDGVVLPAPAQVWSRIDAQPYPPPPRLGGQ